MKTTFRERVSRAIPPALAGGVPTLLLAFGVARFVINHFYTRAPYLLDAGLLSKVVYRDGLLLHLPRIAVDYADSFYDVHFSPLSSAFSLISYVVPVGRIEWYAIVEGLLYVPIGIATYAVASRLERETALRRLPVTVLAAVAFASSGLVLWMVAYPHFEVAVPGLTCVVLAALVTGRRRTAWSCLVLAAAVKQDAGVHLALAILPLWYLRGHGIAMGSTRRQLAIAIGVALASTIIGITVQHLAFHPVGRLTQAYVGTPPYAHLDAGLLTARAWRFVATDQAIYYPFLASCLVALFRRDAKYLLGWAACVPWLVFNLFAVEDSKAAFDAYGVAPFLVGVFWVYLYGAHLATRRMRAHVLEVTFALVCLASTLGLYRAQPYGMWTTVRDMAVAQRKDRGRHPARQARRVQARARDRARGLQSRRTLACRCARPRDPRVRQAARCRSRRPARPAPGGPLHVDALHGRRRARRDHRRRRGRRVG